VTATGTPEATDASRRPSPNATSSTPTVRAVGRKGLFWVVAGVGALLVAIVATLLAGGSAAGGSPLASDNPAPPGGMALAEVLRDQGVTVLVADTFAEAESAAASAADPTIFFFDEVDYLTSDRLRDLLGSVQRAVVVAPDFSTLEELAPGVGFGGVSGSQPPPARCDVPAAAQAGTLSPGGKTLRLTQAAGSDYTGCFPTGDGTFSIIESQADGVTLTLVADSVVFSNEEIADYGNAALALNLLGVSDTVIWYLPTIDDVARTGPPSPGELTPGWVTPLLLLLVTVFGAAALWRGRRFGPLVAENLPVAVKASETMEGRARLYAASSARLRAIDALRIGTVQRLARQAGLSRTADLDEIIAAVAELTGWSAESVRTVLVDAVPHTDRHLVALSDQLQDLERRTARATDPSQAGSTHGRMDS
jgi:hypothetical protein